MPLFRVWERGARNARSLTPREETRGRFSRRTSRLRVPNNRAMSYKKPPELIQTSGQKYYLDELIAQWPRDARSLYLRSTCAKGYIWQLFFSRQEPCKESRILLGGREGGFDVREPYRARADREVAPKTGGGPRKTRRGSRRERRRSAARRKRGRKRDSTRRQEVRRRRGVMQAMKPRAGGNGSQRRVPSSTLGQAGVGSAGEGLLGRIGSPKEPSIRRGGSG